MRLFSIGDWACDDLDRKSVSGGYLTDGGGCRLHRHSRTAGQHTLSSGESEIMSMSEVLKEAKLMQYNLEFCDMGLLPTVLLALGWRSWRLSALSFGVVVRMDEFALSVLSQESAFNSSSHVSVFNCGSALDTIIVT